MIDNNQPAYTEQEKDSETYPVQPRYHPIHKIPRVIYDFLASARLAMALLLVILSCSVAGVTIWRGETAWQLIFSTVWFNSILVLLVVNVACCFFGRIWGRRITIVSFGMILFHLSFVAMFAGIVYNSLFFFDGILRLTEGETLRNGDPQSYDTIRYGRFFSFSKLKGETTLIKMYKGYRVGDEDKRVAYEVAVGEGASKKQQVIYVTKNLSFNGIKFFPEKEGYSPLVLLADGRGREIYGAYIPLQSLRQADDSYFYTTGTKDGPGAFLYPQEPLGKPLFDLQVTYLPSKLDDRGGEVTLSIWPIDGSQSGGKPIGGGRIPINSSLEAAGHKFMFKELRYWVGMKVRYDPGKPFVLTSLWIGLAGMLITTVGRMMRSGARKA
ncbi:hypothetical protein [Geobacter sp. DSM 9736]|uniref:hypothetical protein n=1 Tax=Geobacter sp. DSM 9736 TaxID=1277350 RepID=UPI000B510A30|nr:hypothetical protein [Geobacter sp. DSM 9736]SNB47902.1 hypothetical protein SAMN06269301_3396 [Geobacter sp. DSM 9736]